MTIIHIEGNAATIGKKLELIIAKLGGTMTLGELLKYAERGEKYGLQ
jgi:hypothetical protein